MLSYIASQLNGAWNVMRGRASGLAQLDLSIGGFWPSFGAAILLLPFWGVIMLSQRRMIADLETAEASKQTPAGVESVGLAIDWMAFPIVFALLARPLGLATRYVPFIVARNWSAVVIGAILSVLHVLHLTGIIPSSAMPLPLLALLLVNFGFAFVIARTALEAPAATTIGIVLLDFLISLLIWSVADRMGSPS